MNPVKLRTNLLTQLETALGEVVEATFNGKTSTFSTAQVVERLRILRMTDDSNEVTKQIVLNLFDISVLTQQGWDVEITGTTYPVIVKCTPKV